MSSSGLGSLSVRRLCNTLGTLGLSDSNRLSKSDGFNWDHSSSTWFLRTPSTIHCKMHRGLRTKMNRTSLISWSFRLSPQRGAILIANLAKTENKISFCSSVMLPFSVADIANDITLASLSLTWFSDSHNKTGPGTIWEPRNAPITLHWQNRTGMAPVRMKLCEKILPIASKVILAPCRFDGEAKGTLISSPSKCISKAYSQNAENISWVRPPQSSPTSSVKVTFVVEETTSSLS